MPNITVTQEGGRYIARFPFDYATKDIVKGAGFRFDPQRKLWWTDRPEVALKVAGDTAEIAARINAERAAQHAKDQVSIAASRATDAKLDVPAPRGLAYLPYQRGGIAYAASHADVLIADEMGLGKTIQALGIINSDDAVVNALVIVPASLKLNWQREAGKWLTRGFALIVASSRPTSQISNTLISAFALAHEIRANRNQKRNNLGGDPQTPSPLRLSAFDAPPSASGPVMDASAKLAEKFDQTIIGIGEGNPPRPVSRARSISTDPTLPVDNSGHIGQDGDILRGNKGAGHPAFETELRYAGQPNVMIAQGSFVDAEASGNGARLRALLDTLESCPQISIAYSAGPCQGVLLIINYEIVSVWRTIVDSASLDWLCADEAHYLKSSKSQRTHAIFGKWDNEAKAWAPAPIRARRRVFLTGTPVLNRPKELWTLVHALDPQGLGKNWREFHIRYCAGHQTRYGWDVDGASNLSELQARLRSSIMVRRLKSEVLTELPPKRRQVIALVPSEAARKVLAREQAAFQAREERLQTLLAAVEVAKASDNPDDYKAALDRLHKGAQEAFEDIARVRHEVAVAKIPQVVEHLTDCLENGKVVCFAHHHDVIDALRKAFPQAAVVTGETPVGQRQGEVDRFQTQASCNLFVGSIHAAGVGYTLTASSHVVFAELDWTPGWLSQAEDRCHRIGQRDCVVAQHVVLDGSLDMRMAELLVEKQETIEAALDRGEALPDVKTFLPPVAPAATRSLTQARVAEEAALISPEAARAVHEALRALAAMCDGAQALDGHGFNKLDTYIGKSLANSARLTPKQAVLGRKIALRYHRQLPADLVAVIKESR